jgi:hypothetical protein
VATAETGIATPISSVTTTRNIDLKGKVVAVDLQRNVASVSLGAASGACAASINARATGCDGIRT